MILWWAALVVLAVVGLPIAALVLDALPDRGAALALPTSLVVLFVPVYWLGHLRFGTGVVVLGALLLAAASVLASRRAPTVDRERFLEWLVVFSLAYAFLIAIRAVDPIVIAGGGEKFLDYGLLRSLLRATRLPPQDVWFAGEPVKYYYGGHLLAASLTTLTGTAARYAYNLALAGFYAALVAGAYGVAGSIAASRGRSYRLAGGLAAFLVGVASNVAPLLQAALWTLPDGVARPIAVAVADRTAMPLDPLLSSEAFSYWTASRVIPDTINEFPLFAFLNGDLHAHMMSTSLLLLVVGVCLAYALTPAGALRRRRLLVYGAIPPVAGTLAVVNTWSFPTVAGLVGLTVLFADAPARDLLPGRLESPRWLADRVPESGGRADGGVAGEVGVGPGRVEGLGRELVRMGSALVAAAGVTVVGVLWVLPFFLGPATGADGRSLGLLPERSGLLPFLLVHGWFLLVFGVYLVGRATVFDDRRDWALLAGLAVVVVAGLLFGAAAVALVLLLLALAWNLLRREDGVGYEAVLFVAGAGLVLLVEFLFVEEQAGPGRLNTVFKVYMQVWVLWGTGAGAAVAGLVPGPLAAYLPASLRGFVSRPPGWPDSLSTALPTQRERRVAVAFVVLLVAATSVYAVTALGAHFEDAPEPTLDGTTNARTYHPGEWEAIRFLEGQPGQPAIVDAPACWCNPGNTGDVDVRPYHWANAPSTFSGLPTVAGWGHEIGYRGSEPYAERVGDVETIYTGSPEARLALLRQYDVRYVYVGPNERALYGEVTVGESPELTVAFQNDAVTVYEVEGTGG